LTHLGPSTGPLLAASEERYGLFRQIVPTDFGDMMKDLDQARVKGVAEAMLKMIRYDIEGLKKAYKGRLP
jgi:predicted 3-demethylubiquinone-9 3-methyltransferase (glyoxalase superfamily)